MQIHVVEQGDSLWRISQKYGSDMNQIVLLNQLNNPDTLVIGQSLVIPDPVREYVVQPGDSVYAIAQRIGVSIEELAEVNNITNPAQIYAGEMLILPYFSHEVKPGENLWSIASRYGTTVNQLAQVNSIANPTLIYPGQTLRVPALPRPLIEVNAYTTKLNVSGSQEVRTLGRNFTYLSLFMYAIQADGSITQRDEQPVLDAAASTGALPLLVLTNFSDGSFDSDLAATLLRSPQLQDTLITNLLEVMGQKGYRGVNVDFEYVYQTDRDNYNDFLRRLTDRLRPQGFLVSTALAPKISADQQGLLYEAHDYETQANIVDFIVLMTYEWGWAGGRPWAIAPINKVREVLDYAVTVIPRDKILMGMPLYGRDWKIPWVEGTLARTVSPVEAVQLAANYGVAIQYNEEYQSPFFRYTDNSGQEHEVWFEDARSVQAKYDTIKIYGLRGASYWVLGSPFPQNWPVLQSNFRVKKL
ncbi:MAG: LysM peptidoglycan-binding domain-containing protein [Halobacillus sp.]|uniref:LysM peptidoglycan-binding domain-containing protein n=1 Tax=Halobacillus sp. TaxID=56800 RepID=UPI003BAED8E0